MKWILEGLRNDEKGMYGSYETVLTKNHFSSSVSRTLERHWAKKNIKGVLNEGTTVMVYKRVIKTLDLEIEVPRDRNGKYKF